MQLCSCGRKSRKDGRQCNTCITRRYRLNNQLRATYQSRKDNAKRRGKAFSLTFAEFCEFAVETDYIRGKGITAKSLTIDRIDETGGYHIDNIQAIPNAANIRKFLHYKHDGTRMVASVTISRSNLTPDPDVPF
jgi:hypothetical protein